MTQLVQENKSLWRIKNKYMDDIEGCEVCRSFWAKLEKDKEGHIAELKKMIQTHISG